jgi:aspartyl/asparaginyl beta-hydroxylase (cupin superfamily)
MNPQADALLDTWLPRIRQTNLDFRAEVGQAKYGAVSLASQALAAPRTLRKMMAGRSPQPRPELQCPWLPYWPRLTAKPLHSENDYAWTEVLRQANQDIRQELLQVQARFGLARYDSEFNPTRWHTYYFFLHGRPNTEHLAACPRTHKALEQVPHNGFHVCFSALEPGGSLHPHTGPTNASLTAHLGLLDCAGSSLWVGGETAQYRDGRVLVFDDSFVHWVDNVGSKRRYTLMITFWHPELSALERAFLSQVVKIGAR